MAVLSLEDLYGTVEVIVFPRDYEKFRDKLEEESKVLITGRVSGEADRDSKLILTDIKRFSELPKKLWIQIPGENLITEVMEMLKQLPGTGAGRDTVCIYQKDIRKIIPLPSEFRLSVNDSILERLKEAYGSENVKVT